MTIDGRPSWREQRLSAGRRLGALPRSRSVERWYDRAWLSFGSLGKVLVVAVIGLALMPATGGAVAVWTILNLDTKYLPADVPDQARPTVGARPTRVFDANGKQIAEFREFDLSLEINRDDIPKVMKDAIVAAEDRRFYQHRGVDVWGVLRAVWENYRADDVVQGGSTLTQQYVKNAYTGNERSYERKKNEAVIAMQLEAQLEDRLGAEYKDEIIFLYLDSSYFGDGLYGVGAAAESWFGKSVQDLTLSEAALIAGVVRSPGSSAPRTDPTKAEEERERVLGEMREMGFIGQIEYEEALAEDVKLIAFGYDFSPGTWVRPSPPAGATEFPFFVDYVRQYLEDKYGHEVVYRGGLQVTTTLDPRIQQLAESTVAEAMAGTQSPLEMSLVSVDPRTGHVRALVGGRDFEVSQVNLATGGTTGFQPGSSFKPYTLAAALERGATPDTVYPSPSSWRVPGCSSATGCTVEGGNGAGRLPLRRAIAASTNTVFAQLAYDVGPSNVAAMARRVGVTFADHGEPENGYGVSITLGAYEVSPLDMASGFATFAASGRYRSPTPVLRITDEKGDVVLEDNTAPPGERVLHPAIADTVTDMLTGVVTGGTGRRAQIGRPVAGKTGTAQENWEAWFAGYTPQLSTAVWLGHSDTLRTVRLPEWGNVEGGELPARTWANFMSAALEGEPELPFPEPGPLPPPVVNSNPDDSNLSGRGGEVRGTGLRGRQTPAGIGTGCGGECIDALPPTRLVPTTALPPLAFPPTTQPPPTTVTTTPSTTEPDPDESTTIPSEDP